MSFPVISINHRNDVDSVSITIKNVGQGPAVIEGFKMKYHISSSEVIVLKNNDSEILSSMADAFKSYFVTRYDKLYCSTVGSTSATCTCLEAGGIFTLYSIKYSPKKFNDIKDWLLLQHFLFNLHIKPIYRSQYKHNNRKWKKFAKVNPARYSCFKQDDPYLPFISRYIGATILDTGEVKYERLPKSIKYIKHLDQEPNGENMATDIKSSKFAITKYNEFLNMCIYDYLWLIGFEHLLDRIEFELANINLVKDLWNCSVDDLMSMDIPRYQAKRIIYRN